MWRRMLNLWRTWRGVRPVQSNEVPARPWHVEANPDVWSATEFDPNATLSPALFARRMREAGLG